MKSKLCCIFNYAPLYRKSIFMQIDNTYDVQFVFDSTESDIPRIDNVSFKRQPIYVSNRNLKNKLFFRTGILKFAHQNYDKYLIIGDFNISFIPFLLICRITNKKVYAWGHGLKEWGGFMSLANKVQMKLIHKYFTYGEKGMLRMIDMGVPANKLSVIYNSLTEKVDPIKNSRLSSSILAEHFNNDYPNLIFVGRLTKIKKLDWIIEAMSYHKRNGIFYNVLFVGDGEEWEILHNLVIKNDLQKSVWFYGRCYDVDVLNKLIYNSCLCISPGNVGLTALHAMMYGVPVISHDKFEEQVPEYEVIIPGKTGMLYQYNNKQDFWDKIEWWLKQKFNRDEIRSNCYDVINSKWNSSYQIELLRSIL